MTLCVWLYSLWDSSMWWCVSVLFSFLWPNNISLCVYTTICLYIHLLLGLWAFSSLAILNNAPVNMFVHVFVWVSVFNSLSIYPEELLGHSKFMVNFLKNCQTGSTGTVPFYFSTSNVWEYKFLHILPTLAILYLEKKKNCSLPCGCEVVSHCGFDFHFLSN